MTKRRFYNRLSVRLTAAFLLAASLGVILVAVITWRVTSSGFTDFVNHVNALNGMMGGGSGGGMMGAGSGNGMMFGPYTQDALNFLNSLTRTLWLVGLGGVALALVLGWLFTRQIVAPVAEAPAAARRVVDAHDRGG